MHSVPDVHSHMSGGSLLFAAAMVHFCTDSIVYLLLLTNYCSRIRQMLAGICRFLGESYAKRFLDNRVRWAVFFKIILIFTELGTWN